MFQDEIDKEHQSDGANSDETKETREEQTIVGSLPGLDASASEDVSTGRESDAVQGENAPASVDNDMTASLDSDAKAERVEEEKKEEVGGGDGEETESQKDADVGDGGGGEEEGFGDGDPTALMEWKDGIGTLPGSSMKVRINFE